MGWNGSAREDSNAEPSERAVYVQVLVEEICLGWH